MEKCDCGAPDCTNTMNTKEMIDYMLEEFARRGWQEIFSTAKKVAGSKFHELSEECVKNVGVDMEKLYRILGELFTGTWQDAPSKAAPLNKDELLVVQRFLALNMLKLGQLEAILARQKMEQQLVSLLTTSPTGTSH